MPKIIQGPKKKDQPSKPVARRTSLKHTHKVDVATKPSWLKRFLVWLGIKKRDWDYSCMVVIENKKDKQIVRDISYY